MTRLNTFDDESVRLIVEQVRRVKNMPESPQRVHDPRHLSPPGGKWTVADITESGGIAAGATGEVTPKDSSGTPGTPYQATNGTNVDFDEDVQVITAKGKGWPNQLIYPYQFSECSTPQPINVSPEV